MEQNTVQILRKKIRIAIKDDEKVISEIAFNPDDTRTYRRFLDIIEMLTTGKKKVNEIEAGITPEDLERKLETIEDFENASKLFEQMKAATNVAAETWEEVCRSLDELFGAGVCKAFTGGDIDPELLTPLIDSVMPYFKKSREGKMKPYLKK